MNGVENLPLPIRWELTLRFADGESVECAGSTSFELGYLGKSGTRSISNEIGRAVLHAFKKKARTLEGMDARTLETP